jgi:hypothetical protein
VQIGADGMVEFPDLTDAELDFRARLRSPRRWKEFVREVERAREASGQAAEDRRRYEKRAGRHGWT